MQTISLNNSNIDGRDVELLGTLLSLESLKLALLFDRSLDSFLREIKITTSKIYFTSGNVNMFSLA